MGRSFMLITYFWEVIAFQGSEGSFTKHQLVIISQNLFTQLITASVMMVRDKFIKKIVIESNGPPNQSLSMFLGRNCEYYDSLLDGIPLHCKFTPQHFIAPLWQFAAIPGGGRHCEREVFCQRTQDINLARSQTCISQPKVQPSNHYTIVSLKGIIYIFLR